MDGIYRMEDPDRKPANDLNNFELIDVQRLSVSSCKTETPTANNEHSYSYEDVLDMIGFGKTQIIVLLVSGLLLMAVINETMGMSIITIASQCDFSTTSMEKGLMGGAAFIGKSQLSNLTALLIYVYKCLYEWKCFSLIKSIFIDLVLFRKDT